MFEKEMETRWPFTGKLSLYIFIAEVFNPFCVLDFFLHFYVFTNNLYIQHFRGIVILCYLMS